MGGGESGWDGGGCFIELEWDREGGGLGWPLFEAGRLLTFSSFRMGAYSRWALIRINTVGASIECINKILQLQIANYRPVFKPCSEKFKGPHGDAELHRMFF